MKEHQKKVIDKFLDKLYGSLVFRFEPNGGCSWCDGEGTKILLFANSDTLMVRIREIKYFVEMFSLPWEVKSDNSKILKLIIPHLKFNDGSQAIPQLINLGFVKNVTSIYYSYTL